MTIRVKVDSLKLDSQGHPLVILADDEGRVVLTMDIGLMEASAIAAQMEGLAFPRPMTHDLLATLLSTLDTRMERLVIRDIAQDTFLATLVLTRQGETLEVDCRPSDGMALALRLSAPIEINPIVLEKLKELAVEVSEEDNDLTSDLSLEELDDEDFPKYKM